MVETGSDLNSYFSESKKGVVREVSMPDGTMKRFIAWDAAHHPAMESQVISTRREFHAPPKRRI